jgi:hypothetical protein
MRHRAADKRDLAHSRKPHVSDILPAAVEETVVLLPAKPSAHSGLGQGWASNVRRPLGESQRCHFGGGRGADARVTDTAMINGKSSRVMLFW